MTAPFEDLKERPRTGINKSKLNATERTHLRSISVDSCPGHVARRADGEGFTTVYYLEGDDRRALATFAAENAAVLDAVDFSRRNVVRESLSQPMYDALLDELGVRERRTYRNTVVEERPDGTTWVVDRDHYESHPRKRYSVGSGASARLPDGTDPQSVYDAAPPRLDATDLAEQGVEGRTEVVLQFYRDCGLYDCEVIDVTGPVLAKSQSSDDPVPESGETHT